MNNSTLQIRRWVATVVVLAALAAGGVLALGLRNWTGHPVLGAGNIPLTVARDATPVLLGSFANGFASVLKPALPAVVNIHSSKVVKPSGESPYMPFFNDPFLRQFFGDPFGQVQPHPQREVSLGSGVIVSSDGTILTNNHVVEGASDIKVQLSDKREFKAKLIGADTRTDVAVLKIDAKDLPTLTLGDSSKMQVGDMVFAIGDPFGVGETATMGIVSATGRSIGIEGPRGYEDFIQTDAAINPGNSGGAMIDLHGDLIGINTAIVTGGGGGNQGIGFAIPINMARQVMDQLVAHGKVVRGYLGVSIQTLTPELAKQFGLNQSNGVLIGDVTPDSPAARAGLRKGDVVLELNGEPVNDNRQLSLRIAQIAPGTSAKLKIWRDGKSQDVNVPLSEWPDESTKATSSEDNDSAIEGVEVQDLTSDIAQQLNLAPGTRGVVVTSVDPASPAASAGLERGFVIQEVNHKPVNNIRDYRRAVAGADKQPVLLLVNQGGQVLYMVIEPH
jgi:serine protease Do